MLRLFIGGLAFSFMAACATPAVDPDNAQDVSSALEVSGGLAGLPAQKLAPSECGLFLWSKTDTSRFVFFAKAGANQALFLLDDTPAQLQSVSEQGQIFGQFYTDTKYVTESGQEISLSYESGEDLTNGARISNGTIQYSDKDGWLTVLPVLGVRVCQPAVLDNAATAQTSSDL